jgi:NADH dehydrogenase FAD-containing subunit
MSAYAVSRNALLLVLLLASFQLLAHEGWILTPAEMLEWNSKPKPDLFIQWSPTNIAVIGGALLFAMVWVRLGFTGARELFPDLQARLSSYGEYSAVILRVALAWTLLASAFAMEPRVGNDLFESPTFLAPDLELRLLGPDWMWLREAQIVLGLMFLFGVYVRLAAALLLAASVLATYLFGRDMLSYLTAVWGIALYLLLQGPGRRFVPLPVPRLVQPLVDALAAVPRQRAQFLLRILVGLNFLFLGIYFKVLQPNLALGIIETYQVPILSLAPEFFVLLMAVVETFAGIFLLLGILMRPMSIFLLGAFIFFASFLEESFTAHMMFYGALLTFLFNGAGHWRKPEARDTPADIVILGGSFSAIRAAMKLEKLRGRYSNVNVTLVSPNSEFLFHPMLPEVVGGSVQPASIVNPIRRILPATRVIEGRADRVDTGAGTVHVKRIDGGEMTLPYSQLVEAASREPNFNGIGGLAQHALPIDTIGDALYLRQAVLKKLAQAEHMPVGEERRGLLSFAVLGAGERASGTAMEIRRLLKAAESAYPGVDPKETRVTLFEDSEQREHGRLGAARNRVLARRGVERRELGEIDAITISAIHLMDGRVMPCATVVNARYQLPEDPLQAGARHCQPSERTLALEGQQNIWLAGDDNALLQGQKSRQCELFRLGNVALQLVVLHGRRVAHSELYRVGALAGYNAWAASQGFPLFQYKPRRRWLQSFHMGRSSVAQLGPIVLGGIPAWFLSRISCLSSLPGLERNLRIIIDWILDIPFRNEIAVLTPDRSERLSQAYFHAGDVLLREGDRGDTAYIVQSGRLSVYVAGEKVGERGRGDILGELALINDAPRNATAICDTDVAVTCLNRDQFMELMSGLSVFGEAIRKRSLIYQDQQALENAPA